MFVHGAGPREPADPTAEVPSTPEPPSEPEQGEPATAPPVAPDWGDDNGPAAALDGAAAEQEDPAAALQAELKKAAEEEATAQLAEGLKNLGMRTDVHTVDNKRFCVELADARRQLAPVDTFPAMGLKPEILESINIEMEYSVPFRIQQMAVPIIFNYPEEALLAQAQAGSGKTAAFTLGILQRVQITNPPGSPQAIILAPTHELVHQHVETVTKMSRHMVGQGGARLTVGVAVGQGGGGRGGRGGRGRGRGGGRTNEKVNAHVVVGTVGKINSMLSNKQIVGNSVKIVVFDEADSLLHRADEYNMCKALCEEKLVSAQPLFFSATFTEQLKARIRSEFLHGRRKKPTPLNSISLITEHADQEGLIDECLLFNVAIDCACHKDGKFGVLTEIYQFCDTSGVTLIFVETRATAHALERRLQAMNFAPLVLTGDIPKDERLRKFDQFKNGNEFNVCICTNVLALGIDITKITMVINYDLPTTRNDRNETVTSFEAYLQRGGRSTRAGSRGILMNLVHGDMGRLREIEDHFWRGCTPNSKIQLVPPDEDNEFEIENLKAMIRGFLDSALS